MSQDQINAYLRTACTLIGGILMTSAGWSQDQVTTLTTGVLGLAGLVFLGISLYGSFKAHSVQGRVTSVAAIPGTTVVTQPEIATVTPDNVVPNTMNKVVPKVGS